MSTGIVTAHALRVREGPSRTDLVLGLIYKGEIVELLDTSPEGTWKNLRTVEGIVGWSSAKYLLDQGGEPLPDPEPATGQYRVTAHALYVREGPGRTYRAIGYLKRDDVVSAISVSADGKWKQIRHANGLAGWCSGKYLFYMGDPEPPPEPNTIRYQVTAYALYVREGPGSSYKAITYLREGDIVSGISTSADGKWRQIRLNSGEIGWSSCKYLSSLGPEKPPFEPDPEAGQFRVTTESLHLRLGPNTGYESVGMLKKGEIVTAIEPSPDKKWFQIQRSGGEIGWCASDYLYCLGGIETPAGETNTTGFHRCIINILDLHAEANQDAEIVGQLTQEETVDVLEISQDEVWKKITAARGLIGWCEGKYLTPLGNAAELQPDEEFPWMPIAFNDLGLREFPGAPNNPRILEYMASTNLRDYPFLPDETEWCAAFVNWCIEQAGIEATGWATVSPWMAWGEEIKEPLRGCVVTFQWDDGGQHVAFYLGECGDHLRALGGNQSNAVWIKSYPKKNVVNYRIPKDWS